MLYHAYVDHVRFGSAFCPGLLRDEKSLSLMIGKSSWMKGWLGCLGMRGLELRLGLGFTIHG